MKTFFFSLALTAAICSLPVKAEVPENYPDLDVSALWQESENILDSYTPPFDKATVAKMMTPYLRKAGYSLSKIKKVTFGSGEIGKNRKVVVAMMPRNTDTTTFYIADVTDGEMAKPVVYKAVFVRSELEITQKCKNCGEKRHSIYCMQFYSEQNMFWYLIGVWHKYMEAPQSEQQTLPFFVRLFE